MLVVMFIVVLFSAVILANYRQGEKDYALSADAQNLVAELRRAQNMAMSGVELSGDYYGYGIRFSKSVLESYILFADENDSKKYDGSDKLVKTISLSEGIKIKDLSVPSNNLDIYFASPDPITYINGTSTPGASESVTLEIEGTSKTKTITVSASGLITLD